MDGEQQPNAARPNAASRNPIKRWSYPFQSADGKEIDTPQAFYSALAGAEDGFYPLGVNGLWHGGVHFGADTAARLKQDTGVRCIADGEVIAYRVDTQYPTVQFDDGKALYSTGFTLVRHQLELPAPQSTTSPPAKPERLTFFSLYMHLSDWQTYQSSSERKHPSFWRQQSNRYRVGARAMDRQLETLEPSVPSSDSAYQPEMSSV